MCSTSGQHGQRGNVEVTPLTHPHGPSHHFSLWSRVLVIVTNQRNGDHHPPTLAYTDPPTMGALGAGRGGEAGESKEPSHPQMSPFSLIPPEKEAVSDSQTEGGRGGVRWKGRRGCHTLKPLWDSQASRWKHFIYQVCLSLPGEGGARGREGRVEAGQSARA